jgi:hypothetical protein
VGIAARAPILLATIGMNLVIQTPQTSSHFPKV